MVPWVSMCTVIVAIPSHYVYFLHGAMGLSVYCKCGISWLFCAFSSWCHGLVSSLVIVVLLCHTVSFPHGAMGLSV